jgi:type II secretory pathway component PulJ
MTTLALSHDQGFTLAEAVMSLLVVSLALAGLLQVTAYNARSQARIGTHQKDLKLIDQQSIALERVLNEVGAVEDRFTGRKDYLSAKDAAGIDHEFRAPHGWQLKYLSNGQALAEWPPLAEQNLEISHRSKLGAVALSNDKGQPVKVARVRIEQNPDCQFDMISRDCRAVTP